MTVITMTRVVAPIEKSLKSLRFTRSTALIVIDKGLNLVIRCPFLSLRSTEKFSLLSSLFFFPSIFSIFPRKKKKQRRENVFCLMFTCKFRLSKVVDTLYQSQHFSSLCYLSSSSKSPVLSELFRYRHGFV